ncbi:MAG: DUF2007 domain-containing protein [Holophagaceae bacterium]|nr:DUF2007 domain-containing protein [Holophagaceae bacterium]
MLKVLTARHPIEARMIEGLLEAHGIRAEVRGEDLYGTVDGGTYVPAMLPTVWVIEDAQASLAEDVIGRFFKEGETSTPPATWQCPTCAEVHESQFTACWQCDTPRPLAAPA